MLDACLNFWGLADDNKKDGNTGQGQYTLVLPNMHDIMSLNENGDHQAHTISKYFEINRMKRNNLMLIKKDTQKKQIQDVEKAFLKVKHAKVTDRFKKLDERTPE